MINVQNTASSVTFFSGVGGYGYCGCWFIGCWIQGHCLLLVTRATIHFFDSISLPLSRPLVQQWLSAAGYSE